MMLDSKCQKLTKQWNRKPSKYCCSHTVTFHNKFPGKCIMSLFLSSKERNNQMVGLSSEAHLEVITIATDHCHRLHCHRSLPGQQKVQKTTRPSLLCKTKECVQTILYSLLVLPLSIAFSAKFWPHLPPLAILLAVIEPKPWRDGNLNF